MSLVLPSKVCTGPDEWFPVEQGSLDGEFGHVDYQAEKIRIEQSSPEPVKHLILLHEMIHIADKKAQEAGCYVAGLTEAQVEGLSSALWPMLAASGLWPGASEADLEAFASGEDLVPQP